MRGVQEMEKKRIPTQCRYDEIPGLSAEARLKLIEKRPETFGQASRISGVRAADLSIIAVFLGRHRRARPQA